MNDVKYISFFPYYAGLSNVLMSYELFVSIAYITNRKVILPPKIYIDGMTESLHDRSKYYDIWEILNKKKFLDNFDSIEFYDVPEFQQNYEILEGILYDYRPAISYTLNLEHVFSNVNSVKFGPQNLCWLNCSDANIIHYDSVIVNDPSYSLDFKRFISGRDIINVKCPEKFLHFEGNLFGYYWYNIYPGGPEERNNLKKLINSIFKYKEKYYKLSNKVKEKIGNYNSIHIRRKDFLIFHSDELQIISDSESILNILRQLFDKNIPIYISTDENNLSFFDPIRKEYDIYFYSDFEFDLNKLEKSAVEQIICSKSEKFYGTKFSTFSKRINIMRGCENIQHNDDIFLNHLHKNKNNINLYKPFPWESNSKSNWTWVDSSHCQWKIEDNGILKNYKFYED